MFRIGQKVVCVKVDQLNYLTIGQIYTISHFSDGYDDGSVGVHLCEIKTGLSRPFGLGERGFYRDYFRPVVEKKTDISVFTEILRRETVDDRAPARVID